MELTILYIIFSGLFTYSYIEETLYLEEEDNITFTILCFIFGIITGWLVLPIVLGTKIGQKENKEYSDNH